MKDLQDRIAQVLGSESAKGPSLMAVINNINRLANNLPTWADREAFKMAMHRISRNLTLGHRTYFIAVYQGLDCKTYTTADPVKITNVPYIGEIDL